MKKNVIDSPFIHEIGETAQNMYRLGWNERNGGNISLLLTPEEILPYLDTDSPVLRELPLNASFPELAGKHFIVTGTGKYFKNITKDPEDTLGIIRISTDGSKAELLWGYSDGGKFTSEITMHLGAHLQRLKVDPEQKVVLHAHPVNTIAMTHVHSWDEREFTRSIWSTCTECIVIFPEGISVLPWMVSSNASIGLASAEKFKDFRILIWALHGCIATGRSLDEAFGLMETVEKGAEIYMKVFNAPNRVGIDDKMLADIADAFHLEVRPGWLNV